MPTRSRACGFHLGFGLVACDGLGSLTNAVHVDQDGEAIPLGIAALFLGDDPLVDGLALSGVVDEVRLTVEAYWRRLVPEPTCH
jgi:hypothetical protein